MTTYRTITGALHSFFVLFLLILFPTLSFAHTCMSGLGMSEKQFRTFLIEGRTIFRGEVVFAEPPVNKHEQIITVRVNHRWQGEAEGAVRVLYTGAYDSFEKEIGGVGSEKVFFTTWDDKQQIFLTNFCSMEMQDVRVIERMESILGKGDKVALIQIDADEPPPDPRSPTTYLIVGLGVFLLLVAFGFALRKSAK